MDYIPRTQWGARPRSRDYVTIAAEQRPGLETHHSVGVYGTDTPEAFARAVQADHLDRGWTDVFYNWAVWFDGTIVELRPEYAKSGPIADLTVVFAGNYNVRKLTRAQAAAWHAVRRHLLGMSPRSTGIGWHGQRDGSDCPGTSVRRWLSDGAPNPRRFNMFVYATLNDAFAGAALANANGGVWSESAVEAKAAEGRGEPVFAVGGPAIRNLGWDGWARVGATTVNGHRTAIWGANRRGTLALAGQVS